MKERGLTTSEALHHTFGELAANGVPSARDEAEFILMHVLGCKRSELFLNARRPLTAEEEVLLESVVKRRITREPSQYIFGEAEFRGRPFKVTKDVLIPRPETELIIDEALKEAPSFGTSGLTIIDLCTGSGCIGISAAVELNCEVFATDISGNAVAVATENAERLGMGERVRFSIGDLFTALPRELKGRVHMVLSNPPYINEADLSTLAPEVRDFEPRMALAGGRDGLDVIRRILKEAPLFLLPGGLLLMELGYGQKEQVLAEATEAGAWEEIKIINDYAGIGRIFKARSKGR